MALSNSDNNYLRIVRVEADGNIVVADLWRDQATRLNPGEFDLPKRLNIDCAADLDLEAEGGASITDNIVRAGYLALKAHADYSTWEDC